MIFGNFGRGAVEVYKRTNSRCFCNVDIDITSGELREHYIDDVVVVGSGVFSLGINCDIRVEGLDLGVVAGDLAKQMILHMRLLKEI